MERGDGPGLLLVPFSILIVSANGVLGEAGVFDEKALNNQIQIQA